MLIASSVAQVPCLTSLDFTSPVIIALLLKSTSFHCVFDSSILCPSLDLSKRVVTGGAEEPVLVFLARLLGFLLESSEVYSIIYLRSAHRVRVRCE